MTSENQTEKPVKRKKSKLKIFFTILLILILALGGAIVFGSSKAKEILSQQLIANGVEHSSIEVDYLTLTFIINDLAYKIDSPTETIEAKFNSVSLTRVNPFSYLSDSNFPMLFSNLALKGANVEYNAKGAMPLSALVTFDSAIIHGWFQNPKKIVDVLSYGIDSKEFLNQALSFQIEKIELLNLKTKTTIDKNNVLNFNLGRLTTAWNGVQTNILLREIYTDINASKDFFALSPLTFSLAEFDVREIILPSIEQLTIIARSALLPQDKTVQAEMAKLNYVPYGTDGIKVFMENAVLNFLNAQMLELENVASIVDIPNYSILANIENMNFKPQLLAMVNTKVAEFLIDLGFASGVHSSVFIDASVPNLDKNVKLNLDLNVKDLFTAYVITDFDMEQAISATMTDTAKTQATNYPSFFNILNIKYEDMGLIPRYNIMLQKQLQTSYQQAEDNMLLVTMLLQFIRPDLAEDLKKIILEPGIFELTLTRPSSFMQMLQAPLEIPIHTSYTSKGLNLKEEVAKIQAQ